MANIPNSLIEYIHEAIFKLELAALGEPVEMSKEFYEKIQQIHKCLNDHRPLKDVRHVACSQCEHCSVDVLGEPFPHAVMIGCALQEQGTYLEDDDAIDNIVRYGQGKDGVAYLRSGLMRDDGKMCVFKTCPLRK